MLILRYKLGCLEAGVLCGVTCVLQKRTAPRAAAERVPWPYPDPAQRLVAARWPDTRARHGTGRVHLATAGTRTIAATRQYYNSLF